MNVDIGEVRSSVRVVDGEQVVSPRVMERIVRAVLEAMREDEAHRARVREEMGDAGPSQRGWG